MLCRSWAFKCLQIDLPVHLLECTKLKSCKNELLHSTSKTLAYIGPFTVCHDYVKAFVEATLQHEGNAITFQVTIYFQDCANNMQKKTWHFAFLCPTFHLRHTTLFLPPTHISSRGNRVSPVFVFICMFVCVSVIQDSRSQTVWHMDMKRVTNDFLAERLCVGSMSMLGHFLVQQQRRFYKDE